ncbi:MAG: PQQ-dependent sugar dehydrogenase [Planctomycetota bacterium]
MGLRSISLSDDRVPWTNSRIQGSPEAPKPFTVRRAYPNLQFKQPVELSVLPGTSKMLVLEVGGKIYLFEDDEDCDAAIEIGNLRQQSENFAQAFSICPHPDFEQNRQVFVCYSEKPVAKPDGTKLSRFTLELGGKPKLELASEEVLLTWASGGHNGCSIRFDEQGLLYFSAGDGAKPYPPDEYNVSQDLSDLRSTICRIDVDHPSGNKLYSIPADNPFTDLAGARPEIFAYGFRNPWRFCIDDATQNILCGDVGWELWELVFHVEKGGNYGWSIVEGPQPIRSDIAVGPTPIRKPLVAYPHTEGLSVTGGVVYRGEQFKELEGTFLYGDYVTGLLWGMRFENDQVTYKELLAETGLPIISFTTGRDGEVLVMSYNGGIYHLEANPNAGKPSQFPTRLSETGVFTSTAKHEFSPGVYEYEIAAGAYQGGAQSRIAVALPNMGQVVSQKRKRNWRYPPDSVFVKTISQEIVKDGKTIPHRIETQVLHHDGLTWQPYCYVWNEDQSDATLLSSSGASSQFQVLDEDGEPATLNWRHHSRAECRACHTNQTGGAISFSYQNMRNLAGSENPAVQEFVRLGILDKAAPPSWKLREMVEPFDATHAIEDRARAYLHANCAHCHCRGGGGTVALDLVFSNSNEQINALSFPTTQGGFGLEQPKVIVPGDPYSSILYYRMATAGNGHMPKLWSRDNDREGLKLVHDWIRSLDPEQSQNENALSLPLRQFQQMIELPREDRIAAAKAHKQDSDSISLGLYDRLLPQHQRTQRLGSVIDEAKILAMRGDPENGRKQFLASKTLQCRNCHRLEGQGTMVGPDLEKMLARSKSDLLASILRPSEKIEAEYMTQSVLTEDGQVIAGLMLSSSAEKIVLRSADGKTHEVHPDEVLQKKQLTTSLMPVGLAAEMTAQDLADLLAFLEELQAQD